MKKPLIYLAFTDDWELRGDGSGDIREIQFDPMRRLLAIFDKHDIRSTFMVELMQQLTFRKQQDRFPQFKLLADQWDESACEAYKLGHDIQPHIHPQWTDAVYEDEAWRLSGDWSILNYGRDAASQMIDDCIKYLETLLHPVDPLYKCVAFRSGSSVIAPSPFILDLLAEKGFVFDISIVGGLSVNTLNVKYDYTRCDEDFLPYYPKMFDARRMSAEPEAIVCLPIFHFYGSRRQVASQIVDRITSKLKGPGGAKTKKPTSSKNEWAEIGRTSLPARVYDKAIAPVIFGKHLTADIGQLSLPLLREMIAAVRRRAMAAGLERVPVVLTNHSKYMTGFAGFDTFLGEISGADDIKTVTLKEIADMLAAGEFEIKTARPFGIRASR